MAMHETQTTSSIDPETFTKNWSQAEITDANNWITARLPENVRSPVYTVDETISMLSEHPYAVRIVGDLLNLEGPETNGDRLPDPPADALFSEVSQSYVGADGKLRNPNTKFFPRHAYTSFLGLQQDCNKYIEEQVAANGWSARPGIIMDSGYRSPSYQALTLLRTIAERGLDDALQRAALAGRSQHNDYEHPAFDAMIIGDEHGVRMTDERGLPDNTASFEQSLEFEAMMQFGPEHGYWLPFHPDPDNPTSGVSPSGIIFEPWHWQYVGSPEEAKRLMAENRVYEAVAARKVAAQAA